jgi:hypothetical protein
MNGLPFSLRISQHLSSTVGLTEDGHSPWRGLAAAQRDARDYQAAR